MMQLKLEYEAYQRNSETSKQAYYKKKDKVTLKDQIYDLLKNNPLANHQVADTMNIPLSSVCARIRELQIDDKIEDSGKTVKSQYGRDCVIWQRKDQRS
jgi:predicted Rossmann fold nucleotide-binding protein DprA/Smf involved in DNA uptake